MSLRGAVLVRFEESASELRALAWVRTIAAVLALLGASAMLLGELSVPVFMVAVLALLLSVAWLRQGQKARRAAAAPTRRALAVHTNGLAIEEGEQVTWLEWDCVAHIEVDEERLDVVVERRDGAPPLRIEPRYPGVDIYELVHTLDNARRSARPG